MKRFEGDLNVDTRLWITNQTVIFFKGETLRHALHKLFSWTHYLEETKGYTATCISLSWTEGKEYEDGTILMTYKLHDRYPA